MFDLQGLIKEFSNCDCKKVHETTLKDVVIGSGVTAQTGEILKRNGFGKKLLLVADKNTLNAADGVLTALKDFIVRLKIYDNLREATVQQVEVIKDLL